MSGGHFDYNQYKIEEIANEIQDIINNNGKNIINSFGYDQYQNYPVEIINRFKLAVNTLRKAKAMVQRIDWLLSGDDGEESFLERWNEEVMPFYESDDLK
ncbi:hypothetical protein GW891_04755 [bacterium]|nr:hypothetical protein [bacterium]NCQ52062.1 hypothetical protein [archaeon]NCT58913.1 hypothetical protein [archaeon]PJB16999.1 MAG: hypothetical protein CO117_13305 [Flavobacteriaceae bacterium CG_4_9_14_3_um_filter_33_16]